jgi:peptide/nickel transport system permease protein
MRRQDIASFIAKRALFALPLLLGVVVVNFLLIHLAPGDPVTVLVGDNPVSPEYLAQIRAQFGLDKPMLQQLWLYLVQISQGNLGMSYSHHQAVAALIFDRVGNTLKLTVTAMVIATIVGVFLGIIAARFRGRALDGATQTITLLGFSVPEFWLGQILILLFAVQLQWLPSGGAFPIRTGDAGFFQTLNYLILPALALSFRYVALISRMTRASLLEVSNADYVTAARSRGLSDGAVLRRHTLKNAAPPVITVIGYNLGFVIGGSVMIETVFSWPGIGRLLYESIGSRDYPVLIGILLIISVTVVIANLITDIVHMLIDPRVGQQK